MRIEGARFCGPLSIGSSKNTFSDPKVPAPWLCEYFGSVGEKLQSGLEASISLEALELSKCASRNTELETKEQLSASSNSDVVGVAGNRVFAGRTAPYSHALPPESCRTT